MEKQKLLSVSLGVAGIGAAAMYFLDPDRGNRRRSFVRDKSVSIAKRTGAFFGRASRDLGNRTAGAFAETKSHWERDTADDDVLAERIRSKMGRAISHPSAIDVRVKDGRVTLGGDVLQSEFSDLMSCVYSVRGVKDVENKVRTHSSTSGFPSLRATGRERRAGVRGWRRSPGIRLALGATGGALALYGMRKHNATGRVLGAVGVGLLSSEITNTGFSQLAA